MTGDNDTANILKLAELARDNVTGPIGQESVSQAQNRLVNELKKEGIVDAIEAKSLEM